VLSEEKTKLFEFGKAARQNGQRGPTETSRTFDFLEFTHYMRLKGKRGFRVARKPSRKSRNKFLSNTKQWLQRHRDKSVWFHARQLNRKLTGYYNYFGLRYCKPALRHIKWHVMGSGIAKAKPETSFALEQNGSLSMVYDVARTEMNWWRQYLGAGCLNWARPVLRGGWTAMAIPTSPAAPPLQNKNPKTTNIF